MMSSVLPANTAVTAFSRSGSTAAFADSLDVAVRQKTCSVPTFLQRTVMDSTCGDSPLQHRLSSA